MILFGSLVQVKGFGFALVSSRKRWMASLSSRSDRKTPRLSLFFVSLAKKPSMALSQEADVGVKWKTMHLVHSGPVVTHRLASGAQPAGQQVCANAGDISAYAKTKITSLRYPMPSPSLTPIWGREIGSRAKPTRYGRRNRRAQINILIIAMRHDRGGPI